MPEPKVKIISKADKEAGQFALEVDDKNIIPLQEIHCKGCGRFLGFQAIVWGAIKIKCTNSKCKAWNTLDISPDM